MKTLSTILSDNWKWRKQISNLAIFDLKKKARGAVLGWAWFFIKPAMYVFCFWFALEVGLRMGASAGGDCPYIIWLCAGLIPWFFMQDMLGPGVDVLHRFPYLVNKIKFPLSAISTIYATSSMVVELMLFALLLIAYFASGMCLDIHLVQIPVLLFLMWGFWNIFSIMCSQLSAISKDFANLMKAFSAPLFWLSGILFNVQSIPIDWLQTLLCFNPVTFFATSFRMALCDGVWIWENPTLVIGFVVVFVITFFAMLWVYKRFNEEVSDAL